MTKKFISVILAMCMVISMFAVAGFAASAAEGTTFVVAGTANLCTSEWQAGDTDNQMTLNTETGLYEKTYTDLAPDLYLFKVTDGTWDNSWGGPLGNYYLQIDEACDAKITFDPATDTVDVIADGKGVYVPTFDHIYAVGNGEDTWLNGIAWDPAAEENEMTEVSDGVYEITFEDVAEFDNWQIKFSAGSWATNWGASKAEGADTTFLYGRSNELTFDGNNLVFVAPCDLSSVTFTLDISNFDASNGTGAVASYEFTPDPDADYYIVAGQDALCTSNWNQNDFANAMTWDSNLKAYKKVYKDVEPGTYQFKVVQNGNWDTAWGSTFDNYNLVVEETCDVTVTFDDATGTVGAIGDSLGVYELEFDMDNVFIAGNGEDTWMNGYNWANNGLWDSDDNIMQKVSDKVYKMTFTDIPEFNNYQFKFTTYNWVNSWGAPKGEGTDTVIKPSGKKFDLVYNGGNIILDNPTDLDEITVYLDFTDLDYTTGSGAVCWIETNEEAVLDKTKAKFKAISSSFDNSLALNYYVEASIYDGLEDAYVLFQRDGSDEVVRVDDATYNAASGRYAFTFKGIYPQLVGDDITGTLYGRGVDDGVLYCSKAQVYSVKKYAEALFPSANDAMKTLLVDLLNFGAATQIVQNYKTDTLANADLTNAQKAYASASVPELTSIAGNEVKIDADLRKVTWKQASAVIDSAVSVKFVFACTAPIEDVTLKFSIGDRQDVGVYTAKDFTYNASTGQYTVLFDKAFANEFSDKVLVTAYDAQGNVISNTYRYSIESYIATAIGSADANTKALYEGLMTYGYSVVAASNHTIVR